MTTTTTPDPFVGNRDSGCSSLGRRIGQTTWWKRPGRPVWALPALGAVLALAVALYTWDLSANGMANSFYAAAVRSGTLSWKAFLFGSLDPGSFITVDKPPASLWVMELSGRIFGFSSWSMLLPEALAGIGAVYLLHRTVRKWAGELAAVLAALALALTPVATVMFRFNDPDAFLTLLLVASTAALWAAVETGRTRWLVLCGSLVGFAFVTKMLAAFVVLPAFGLVYLSCADNPLKRRVVQLAWAGLALAMSSGWWVALVELWPKSSRPYVGGSTNNSELNLIFGLNGFSRIFGSGGTGPGRAGPGGGGFFGGAPGWLRMFNNLVGGQISWLIPLAVAGLITGLLLSLRASRTDRVRAGWTLWGGWMLVAMAVFSAAKGIFHPYYTVALAPPVAASAGAGALTMWDAGRRSRWLAWILPAAVVVTAVWAVILLGRTPGYYSWLKPLLLVGAIASAVLLFLGEAGFASRRLLAVGAGAVATACMLAGPAAYSLTTVARPTEGALASAGPATTGASRSPFGLGRFAGGTPARLDAALEERGSDALFAQANAGGGAGVLNTVSGRLVSLLESHKGTAKYLVAVNGSMQAAPIIIASSQPVIAMGGFTGTDPAPTLTEFKQLVSTGQVHYVLLEGPGPGGFGSLPGGSRAVPGRLGALPGTLGGFPTGSESASPLGTNQPPSPGGGAPLSPGVDRKFGSLLPRGFGGDATQSAIEQWVMAHGKVVAASAYGGIGNGTLYYVV